MGAVSVLFHLLVTATFVGTLVFDFAVLDELLNKARGDFGGKWKYLTHINLYVQAIYFTLCLIQDIFGTSHGKLKKAVDFIHASLAWPVGCFVTISFWAIYVVDRELVYPKALDEFIPTWVNHCMHTVVLPYLIIDKLLVCHYYPRKKPAMAVLLGFTTLYQAWVLFLALVKGIWVYPLLRHMNWPYRIFFFLLCWNFLFLLFWAGRTVTYQIWGTKDPKAAVKKVK